MSKKEPTPTDGQAEVAWFFSQNLSVFSGKWIAVVGREIVAHGHTLKAVREEAGNKAPGQEPLFYAVPDTILVGV